MKLVFPHLAQAHQVLHSLPIAASIAERHPDIEVHVAELSEARLAFARGLVARYAPRARITYDQLPLGPGDRLRLAAGIGRSHVKPYTLLRNRGYFAGFDAVVTPERNSLFLRRLGLSRTRLIWTRHGAGDREIGFASDISRFDFVLMAGRKIEQRLLEARLIRAGHYRSGVYAKFDWTLASGHEPPKLFANSRPTVLYNPHFRPGLSSWPAMGRAILDAFARSSRYNLIFAPHVRLYDPPSPAQMRSFDRFRASPNLLIDLGSERSIDMSYTMAADIYLGDVSSQVAEFVFQPRPCVFLNAHGVRWQNDPNYQFWQLGPVLDSIESLEDELTQAIDSHRQYRELQRHYVSETFGLVAGEASAATGADAIVEFLRRNP